jgi:hypothetical protein
MKINYAKKYPNLYKITTDFGNNESGEDWNEGIYHWQGTNEIRENRLALADDFVKKQLIPLGYKGIPFPGVEEYDILVQENVGARYLQEFYNLLDDPIRVSDYINPQDIETKNLVDLDNEDDFDDFRSHYGFSDSIEDKWVTYIRVCEIAHNNDVDDAEMTEEFNELVLDTFTEYGIEENSEKAEEVSEISHCRMLIVLADYNGAIKEIKNYLKKLNSKKMMAGGKMKTNKMTKQEFIQKVKEVNAEAHTKEVWAVAKKLFNNCEFADFSDLNDGNYGWESRLQYKNGVLINLDKHNITDNTFDSKSSKLKAFGLISFGLENTKGDTKWFEFYYNGIGGDWVSYNSIEYEDGDIDEAEEKILGDYKRVISQLKQIAKQLQTHKEVGSDEKAENGANIGGYEAEFQKLKGGERDLYGMFKDEILSEEDDNFEGWYKNFTNTREPDTNKTIFKVWQEITGTKPTKETFEQLWNHFKKNKQAKNGANIGGNNEYSIGGL